HLPPADCFGTAAEPAEAQRCGATIAVADGVEEEEQWDTGGQQGHQVRHDECATATRIGHVRETPDVPQSDSRTDGGKDEGPAPRELLPLFTHRRLFPSWLSLLIGWPTVSRRLSRRQLPLTVAIDPASEAELLHRFCHCPKLHRRATTPAAGSGQPQHHLNIGPHRGTGLRGYIPHQGYGGRFDRDTPEHNGQL